jgi:hypothetical protein
VSFNFPAVISCWKQYRLCLVLPSFNHCSVAKVKIHVLNYIQLSTNCLLAACVLPYPLLAHNCIKHH